MSQSSALLFSLSLSKPIYLGTNDKTYTVLAVFLLIANIGMFFANIFGQMEGAAHLYREEHDMYEESNHWWRTRVLGGQS